MDTTATLAGTPARESRLVVRLGGVAGLVLVAIGLSLNFVLAAPAPQIDAPVTEIAAYLAAEGDRLLVSNTLRFLVYTLLPFFAVGLRRFVGGSGTRSAAAAWATLGLLGANWILPVGTVANSMELVGLWQADRALEQPQLVIMIWATSSALFIAVELAWATMILGFSVAGAVSGALPRWLIGLGLLAASSSFAGGLGVSSVMSGGWAQVPAFGAVALFALWVAITALSMVRRA